MLLKPLNPVDLEFGSRLPRNPYNFYERIKVIILGYKTKNFHLSNGMSQSTFYSMKEGGISDTSLKEFLIMEDRFLELEKLSVCSGMSRKYESFELSKLIKDTF